MIARSAPRVRPGPARSPALRRAAWSAALSIGSALVARQMAPLVPRFAAANAANVVDTLPVGDELLALLARVQLAALPGRAWGRGSGPRPARR